MSNTLELYKQALEKRSEQANLNKNAIPKASEIKTSNGNVFSKSVATVSKVSDYLQTGMIKGVEGIFDSLVGIAGTVGTWFGADDEWAKNITGFDVADWYKDTGFAKFNKALGQEGLIGIVAKTVDKGWEGAIDDIVKTVDEGSYINQLPDVAQDVIEGVATSIGQMLPSIAIGNVAGGLGATANVAKGISMASFGASAMGGGIEQGVKEGHDIGTATGYGALQGVKEIAIEAIGGKFGSKVLGVFGKSSAKVGKQTVKSLLKEVSKQAIGEGAEEALGDLFEPLIEKATINKDGNLGEMYADVPQQMMTDFVTGALTGMLMSGGQTITNVKTYGVEGARVQETITEANEVVEKVVKLEKAGKLDADTYKKLQDKLSSLNDQYQEQMQAVKDHYGEFSNKTRNVSSFEGYMNDVKSASSQDLTIRDTIAKYNKLNKTKVGYKALNKNKYTEIIKQLKKDATDSDFDSNAFIDTEGNIYVNKDSKAYKEGKLYNTIGHEFIHSIEKTDGYNELYNNFVKGLSDTEKSDILNKYKETYGNESEQYLLEEAFADYIGENITVNYKEFSKMLGTNSKWSKIKEKLLGYKGVLTEGLRNTQTKVKNALKTATDTSMEMAKASRNDFGGIENERNKGNNEPKDARDRLGTISEKVKEFEDFLHGKRRDGVSNSIRRNEIIFGFRESDGKNLQERLEYERNILQNEGYIEETINNSQMKLIKKEFYTNNMKELVSENKKLGINTEFFVEDIVDEGIPLPQANGVFMTINGTLYLKITGDHPVSTNRHEKMHYFQTVNNGKRTPTCKKHAVKLLEYAKQNSHEYAKFYKLAYENYNYEEKIKYGFITEEEISNRIFMEYQAFVYQERIKLNDFNFQKEINEEFDNELKKEYNLKEIRFSRNATDSNGTKLTDEQIEFFKETKARDENGDLIPLYHGTTWEFYTFDKEKASPEGDMGAGFYFTTNEVDADQNYADEENSVDLHSRVSSLAEQIERTDDVDYEEAERRAKELLVGNENNVLEVYLNINNPAYPETFVLSYEDFTQDYDMNDYEDEYEYYDKVDEDWYEHTQQIMYEVDNILSLDDYNYKELERLFSELGSGDYRIEDLKKIINQNYEFNDNQGNYINNEVVRAIVEACGFDGIIDNQVSKKFRNFGLPSDTTHYIVFKSNQIKLTSNKKPTSNPDIRFSKNNQVGTTTALNNSNNKNSNSKYKQQTPLPTDSNIAWKSWQHLTQQKVYSYTDSYNAVEELLDNVKTIVDGKITVKGGKKALATKLMQDLANPTNLSINDVAVKLSNNFNDVLVDGVSLQDTLDGIESGLYSKFVDANIEVFNTLLNNYKPAKYQTLINKYNSTVSTLKNKLREAKGYATELIKTVKTIDNTVKKHDAKIPVGERATDFKVLEELQPLMDKFKLLRKDYLKHDIRNVVLDIQNLLTSNSHLVEGQYVTDELLAEFKVITEGISNKGDSKLDVAEMKALRKIIQAINHIYNTYDSAIINGKKVVASELAKKGVNDTNVNVFRIKHPTLYKIIEFIKDKILFINPMTKFSLYQNRGFQGSYFESIYSELRFGENRINEIYDDLTFDYIQYMNKHKKLATRLTNKEFEIEGHKLTDAEVIELYMLSERGDVALRHILTNDTYSGEGIKLIRDTHNVSVKVTQEDLDRAIKYVKSNYVGYLDIIQEIFWKKSGKYLNETVQLKTGYELTDLEEHYFPINVDPTNFEKQIGNLNELNAQHLEMINPSFTKSTSKNANNAILVQGIDVVLSSFARKLSNYAGFSPTVQNINRILNSKVEYNGRETTFMKYMQENVDINFNDYMNKLLINMQGRLAVGQKGVTPWLNKLRGNLAKYFLGFNPKTIASQFASYPLIATKLSVDSMTKGIAMKPNIKFMEENSIFFKRRFQNNGIQMSQFLVENNSLTKKTGKVLEKVGDWSTKPMSYTDKLTMATIFNASIVETAKKHKMSVNQVKNDTALMNEALQLAEDIARQTQATNSALDNGSQIFGMGDIGKSLLMFTADTRKAISSLIFGFHESKVTGKKSLVVKSASAIVASQILVALIASSFKQFLNKNDEDKDGDSTGMEFLKSFGTETWHNLSYGMIPFVRDIAGFFTEGYEISDMNFDYINDLLTAVSEFQELADADSATRSKAWYRVCKLMGQTFGIPTKNITEYTNAILSKFDVQTAIKTQNVLYNYTDSSVKKNMALAYKQNRTSRVKANLSTIFESANLSTPSTEASLEIARLYSEGYHQVLPSSSVSSFTIDGQTYTLSNTAQKKFSKVYDEATLEVEDLISHRLYKSLTDEQKAKAIKRIYQAYYGIAKSETTDAYELSQIEEALYHMDGSDLAVHLAKIDSIKATKYKSRKEQVLSYINTLRVSPKAKSFITTIAGYTN